MHFWACEVGGGLKMGRLVHYPYIDMVWTYHFSTIFADGGYLDIDVKGGKVTYRLLEITAPKRSCYCRTVGLSGLRALL